MEKNYTTTGKLTFKNVYTFEDAIEDLETTGESLYQYLLLKTGSSSEPKTLDNYSHQKVAKNLGWSEEQLSEFLFYKVSDTILEVHGADHRWNWMDKWVY